MALSMGRGLTVSSLTPPPPSSSEEKEARVRSWVVAGVEGEVGVGERERERTWMVGERP